MIDDHGYFMAPPPPRPEVDVHDGAIPGATPPPDVHVIVALRLGWSIAEVRGRQRIGDDFTRLGLAKTLMLSRTGNALPLSSQRSPAEQRIEAERVLNSLAKKAGVDVLCGELTATPVSAKRQPASELLTGLAKELDRERKRDKNHDVSGHVHAKRGSAAIVGDLDNLFYGWDAYIQDALACMAFGTSSAYQLGRGLAETFWGIQLDATSGDPRSPAVMLGSPRVLELTDLLSRLTSQFARLAAGAVAFSLAGWEQAAPLITEKPDPALYGVLRSQMLMWRDMLLMEKDPKLYLQPKGLLEQARQLRPVLANFLPEVSLLAFAAAVLAAGAALLTGHGSAHTAGAAVTALGAIGVPASGLAAKLKNDAQGVLEHLRSEMYAAAVAEATDLAPTAGERRTPSTGRRTSHPSVASPGSHR